MELIWVKREGKYFCKWGWTGQPLICPSGGISICQNDRTQLGCAERGSLGQRDPQIPTFSPDKAYGPDEWDWKDEQ
jgi:hypothetical protein